MDLHAYLLRLEENLMTGSARWIADFTESFRDYRIKDEKFDMLVRGSTRPKGFFLSRLFAYFSLPDYLLACFAHSGEVDGKRLDGLIQLVREHMREGNLTWSWLVLPQEGAPALGVKELVRKKEIHEIGIALVDISSGEITTNPSYVGRRMVDHVGFHK